MERCLRGLFIAFSVRLQEGKCPLMWFKVSCALPGSPSEINMNSPAATNQRRLWELEEVSLPLTSSRPPGRRWRDPTPPAGPARRRPSWADTAAPRAPARTASSAAAPGRSPALLRQTTAPGRPARRRRRTEGSSSMSTGPVSPSRAPPGRGCGPT